MKRNILILFVLAISSSLFALSSMPDRHKLRMVKDINNGQFEKAAREIVNVKDWLFDPNIEESLVYIPKALAFVEYADSIGVQESIIDSLSFYVARECIVLCYYYRESTRDYEVAVSYCELGAEITKAVLGEDDLYASSLEYIATIYYKDLGDYSKAEQYLLQALEIIKVALGEKNSHYAGLLNNLGILYEDLGDYSKAEQYYLQALSIRKTALGETHPDYATLLNVLGTLYYKDLGDYLKAEQYYLQALSIRKTVLGETHPDYAASLNNLGILYEYLGDYSKAEQYYLQALSIRKTVLGETHPDYATSLNNLGALYLAAGYYSEAEQYLLQALEIIKVVLGKNNPHYAGLLNNLGYLYHVLRDSAKAEQYLLQALEICKAILGENNPDHANILSMLGIVYKDLGDYSKAEQYHLQALSIRKAVLGETHPDYAGSLNNLGILFNKIGDYQRAEPFLLKVLDVRKSVFLHSLDYMSERQREQYWNTLRSIYEYTFPVFAYRYQPEKTSISSLAYNNELLAKGLLLTSSNSVRNSILKSNDTTLINQWNELNRKKQQILVLEEKDPQSEYLVQVRDEAEQLEKEITRKSTAFRQSNEQRNITWDSVRNHLNKEQIAIEYMIAPLNEDSTMYCALLLRKNSKYPELIPLFEEKEALLLVNTSNESYTSNTYSCEVSEADTTGNGLKLSNLIWGKILPHIKPGETIYFAPSGLLHQLAIENLPYDANHTMSDKYNMVRLSSTREIVLRKEAPKHTSATLYGGIQYDMSGNELLAESKQYGQSDLLASRGLEDDSLDRGNIKDLPGSKTEVENINRLLRENHLSAQLFTSTTANEESFKALSGQHRNIIHIATHGFYWSDSTAQKKDYFSQRMIHRGDDSPAPHISDPLDRCGLLFAGAQTAWSGHSAELPPGVQDGILTAKEISLLDLRDANLVVLSACETGQGEITGEGVFGLQRAFKQAGAQTIIMSLWKVRDDAAQLLMTEFYRNWLSGQAKREAFRNAQNTVRFQHKDPYFWAGFIMLD